MAAPVLTLSSASSPSSSDAYLANQPTQPAPTVPEPQQSIVQNLATLSRNASVISSSSSSSSSSSIVVPARPRPMRTFSNHSAGTARARSPNNGPRSPTTPTRQNIPAAYLPRSLSPDSNMNRLAGFSIPPTPHGSRPGSRQASRPPNGRSRSNSSVQKAISADDFEFGDVLGSGSYSQVLKATHRTNGQTYAVKVIDKSHIIRHRKTKYANIEKTCLARLGTGVWKGNSNPKSPERDHQRKASGLGGPGHPGVIRMHWAFHDEFSLYFVLDLAPNGELLTLIRKQGSLSYPLVKYYTAQISDTLEYIHSMGIIHRDVKPENMLLDAERRIKITDFGTAKLLDEEKPSEDPGGDENQRSSSFVGSALYVSPELLTRSRTGKSADVWALGSIIYYMIAGDAPFKSMSEYLTFERIKKCDYAFPADESPEAFDPKAKTLIHDILKLDPNQRLTLQQIRNHPFLNDISWPTLWTDPAPALEPGVRRNKAPPIETAVFDDEDDDVGDMWDQFAAAHVEDDAADDEEGPLGPAGARPAKAPEQDKELDRVIRTYGKGKAAAGNDDRAVAPFPTVQEVDETSSITTSELLTAPTPVRPLNSVAEETTPKLTLKRTITPPRQQQNTGFVVLSRQPLSSNASSTGPSQATSNKPLPPIEPVNVPSGPNSACSATSSEGSPIDAAGTNLPASSYGLGLFTRVWGKRDRRGSSSSTTGGGTVSGGLGLSVWGNAARRMSSTSGAGSSGPGSSTRSSSNSRHGSRSGGLRGDLSTWLSVFLPGEQVVFHSPVHSRVKRGLFPAKRRVLVLTDLPRLLCIKDSSEIRNSSANGTSTPNRAPRSDPVVKSEVVFSLTTSTSRPQVLGSISERTSESATRESRNVENGDESEASNEPSVEETIESVTTRTIRRPSIILTGTPTRNAAPSTKLLEGIEAKGDKGFVIRTSSKNYTYSADDATTAAQWIREIEDMRANMQTSITPPQSS